MHKSREDSKPCTVPPAELQGHSLAGSYQKCLLLWCQMIGDSTKRFVALIHLGKERLCLEAMIKSNIQTSEFICCVNFYRKEDPQNHVTGAFSSS